MKHLDMFYNKKMLSWVRLIWNSYYNSSPLPPHAMQEKGSFWWKDVFHLIPFPFRLIQETQPYFGTINGQMSSLNFLFLWSSLLLPMNMPPFGLLCTITYHKTSFFLFRHKHYNNTMTSQTFWNPFLSMVKRIFGAIPGEQPSNQRKSMTYFLHIYPLIPQSLQYGKVNAIWR